MLSALINQSLLTWLLTALLYRLWETLTRESLVLAAALSSITAIDSNRCSLMRYLVFESYVANRSQSSCKEPLYRRGLVRKTLFLRITSRLTPRCNRRDEVNVIIVLAKPSGVVE